MSEAVKFNEVSRSYNNCIAKLEDARQIFQGQLKELNEFVFNHLKTMEKNSFRCWWGRLQDWSTANDGAWLNFGAGTWIKLSVKRPGYQRYKTAGNLFLVSQYNNKLGHFMFECRFENLNKVDQSIDETILDIIKEKGSDNFPNSFLIKTNMAILFQRELDDHIFSDITQHVDSAIDVCNEAVERIFPTNLYSSQEQELEEEEGVEEEN